MSKTALILVDLQNDFFPGGALGVPGAEALFPLANELQDHFDLIIASKDWHPKNHQSFASCHPNHSVFEVIQLNKLPQVLWPDHCVQNELGSELHPKLRQDKIHKIIFKGTDPEIDSYSVFFDNAHLKETELKNYLEAQRVTTIYIMGLATEYCVKYSVLDALKLGYKVFVIEDGCCAMHQNSKDEYQALQAMKTAGAKITNSRIIKEGKPHV